LKSKVGVVVPDAVLLVALFAAALVSAGRDILVECKGEDVALVANELLINGGANTGGTAKVSLWTIELLLKGGCKASGTENLSVLSILFEQGANEGASFSVSNFTPSFTGDGTRAFSRPMVLKGPSADLRAFRSWKAEN
jgi:hypothetical protein